MARIEDAPPGWRIVLDEQWEKSREQEAATEATDPEKFQRRLDFWHQRHCEL